MESTSAPFSGAGTKDDDGTIPSSSTNDINRSTTLTNAASSMPNLGHNSLLSQLSMAGAANYSTGNSALSDLELLIALQQQRQLLLGANAAAGALAQHLSQPVSQTPSLSNLLAQQAGNGLNSSSTGFHLPAGVEHTRLLQQAEAILALQRQTGVNTQQSSSSLNQHQANVHQAEPQIPAELAAILQARLLRNQAQQAEQAALAKKPLDDTSQGAFGSRQSGALHGTSGPSSGPEGPDIEAKESKETFQREESNDLEETEDSVQGDGDAAVVDTFPYKLYRMLETAEQEGEDDIISFTQEGRAFTIHKTEEFVTKIMPRYFSTARLTSFQRQLNLYGFRRIQEGPEKGSYFHKNFVKGNQKQCQKIKRKKSIPKPPPVLYRQNLGQSLQPMGYAAGFAAQPNPLFAAMQSGISNHGGYPGAALPTSTALPASMANSLHHQPAGDTLSFSLLNPSMHQRNQLELLRLLLQQEQQRQD